MATSQPLDRLEFAEKEIVRYKEDLDEWKQKHEQLVNYWSPIEDFVPKAIYLYEFMREPWSSEKTWCLRFMFAIGCA
jgi:hypothetical protein